MRTVFYQIIAALWLAGVLAGPAAAEEFRYYVWVDDQGIIHAEERAPKGRDYKVRVIEDINANVVPAKDFRIGDLPADFRRSSDNIKDAESAPTDTEDSGKAAKSDSRSSPAVEK
ncbi:MAG: hypothetical protein WB783_21175 [Arenicellales bacterium]